MKDKSMDERLEQFRKLAEANFEHWDGQYQALVEDVNTLAEDFRTFVEEVAEGGLDDAHDHSDEEEGGSLDHANLTNVTANQHHNEDHKARHEPGGADAMTVDAVATTGSLRTLGLKSTQAAAGHHNHMPFIELPPEQSEPATGYGG